MTKKFFTFILALVAIATTAGAQTKYDIWVGGVQVTSANASNITGGDIKGGTVKYDATENELILRNVTITRSGKSKQGIRNQMADLTITFFGTNTITTDNSCALRCDANTYLWMMPNSKTTFTEKQQEAFYVTGGKSLFITGSHLTELYVNSTNEYAVEGEKGTETVTFQGGPVVTLNGKKGSLVKLGKVVFTESQNKSTSVTLKATNNSSYPQVQNVKAWEEEGYNHIDAPTRAVYYRPALKTVAQISSWSNPNPSVVYSEDIVINEDTKNLIMLDETNFPEATFLSYIKGRYKSFYLNLNGIGITKAYITKPEGALLTDIFVYGESITSLKGIEYFTGITKLDCGANELTSLDVSKNTKLTELDCSGNKLTSLDVSNNTELTELWCRTNKLTSLDVSKNTKLTDLNCYNNRLTSLDVSKNTALTKLRCDHNQLTSLDLSKNTALEYLECSENNMTDLKFSSNAKNLKEIYCHTNKISDTPMLTLVNSLPKVTSGKFYVIQKKYVIERNVITKSQVTIAKNKGWTVYDYNKDTSVEYEGSEDGIRINDTNFPDKTFRLWVLGQSYGKDFVLTDAEIAAVKEIAVGGKKDIASLKGIEYFTALTKLNCWENKLTSLDLSKNTALTYLDCSANQVTSITLSSTKLTELHIFNNRIKGDKMQALVNSLPKVTGGKLYVINTKVSTEQNVITKAQVNIAKGKGWKVYDVNNASDHVVSGDPVEYAGSDETPTSIDNGQLIIDNLDGDWYSIDGVKLNGEPTQKGVYIIKGKKVKR